MKGTPLIAQITEATDIVKYSGDKWGFEGAAFVVAAVCLGYLVYVILGMWRESEARKATDAERKLKVWEDNEARRTEADIANKSKLNEALLESYKKHTLAVDSMHNATEKVGVVMESIATSNKLNLEKLGDIGTTGEHTNKDVAQIKRTMHEVLQWAISAAPSLPQEWRVDVRSLQRILDNIDRRDIPK